MGGLKTGQASIDTTSGGVVIAAARPGRRKILVTNHGATAVYLGLSGVASTTGVLLAGAAGAQVTLETDDGVYGITASGSQTVSYAEMW